MCLFVEIEAMSANCKNAKIIRLAIWFMRKRVRICMFPELTFGLRIQIVSERGCSTTHDSIRVVFPSPWQPI